VRRDVPQALAAPGVLEWVALDVLVRRDVREISLPVRRVFGWQMGAGPQAGSRERPEEADSNLVSEDPWEQQPGELLRLAWRLLFPKKSHAAVMGPISKPQTPGMLLVLRTQREEPVGVRQISQLQAAEPVPG